MADRRSTSLPLALLLALVALALAAPAAPAAPYGNHGRVVTPFPGGLVDGAAIASYGRGTMVVAGTVSDGERYAVGLVRYSRNGTPSSHFGTGGLVETDLGGELQVRDVAVDHQHRILVAGYLGFPYTPATDEAVVLRYLGDGRLDPSFGIGGVARAGRGGAQALAIDRSDRVVIVGGTSLGPFENPWRVARLTESGQIDPSFGGGDGEVSAQLYSEYNVAEDVTIDRDGRIVFAACGENAETPPVFAVGRLRADGSLDESFGAGGVVKVGFGDLVPCAHAVALDYRGRIFVAGNDSGHLVAVRLFRSGIPDHSFGDRGELALRFPNSRVRLGGIAVDGNERLVIAGRIEPTFRGRSRYPARMLIVKRLIDGSPETHFAGDGDAAVRFGPDKSFDTGASSVALWEGAVYAAGTRVPSRTSSAAGAIAVLRAPSGGPERLP